MPVYRKYSRNSLKKSNQKKSNQKKSNQNKSKYSKNKNKISQLGGADGPTPEELARMVVEDRETTRLYITSVLKIINTNLKKLLNT